MNKVIVTPKTGCVILQIHGRRIPFGTAVELSDKELEVVNCARITMYNKDGSLSSDECAFRVETQ